MGCSGSVPAHVSAKIVEDKEDEEDVILRRRHGNCHEVFLSTLATCHKPLGNEVVKDHGLVSATLGKTGIAANGKSSAQWISMSRTPSVNWRSPNQSNTSKDPPKLLASTMGPRFNM